MVTVTIHFIFHLNVWGMILKFIYLNSSNSVNFLQVCFIFSS